MEGILTTGNTTINGDLTVTINLTKMVIVAVIHIQKHK